MSGIIITGCNGLLGSKLIRHAETGRIIVGLDIHDRVAFSDKRFDYEQCDITDLEQVKAVFNKVRPEAVLHTAAFTHVDGCETEKQRSWDINVKGTETIAACAREHSSRLIHVSTDYVFDGREGPYREEDTPNPISHYGRTKLESERAVFRIMSDAVIARTMILYGIESHIRKNFVTWLVGKLRDSERVTIVTDQYGNPTLADDLAATLWALLKSGLRGVFHTAGPEWLNRFDFARRIAECFALDSGLIDETTSEQFDQPAPRPLRSGLICEKLKKETGITMRTVSEGLEILRKQMEAL